MLLKSTFCLLLFFSTDSTEKIPQKLPLHLVSKEVVDHLDRGQLMMVKPDKQESKIPQKKVQKKRKLSSY